MTRTATARHGRHIVGDRLGLRVDFLETRRPLRRRCLTYMAPARMQSPMHVGDFMRLIAGDQVARVVRWVKHFTDGSRVWGQRTNAVDAAGISGLSRKRPMVACGGYVPNADIARHSTETNLTVGFRRA